MDLLSLVKIEIILINNGIINELKRYNFVLNNLINEKNIKDKNILYYDYIKYLKQVELEIKKINLIHSKNYIKDIDNNYLEITLEEDLFAKINNEYFKIDLNSIFVNGKIYEIENDRIKMDNELIDIVKYRKYKDEKGRVGYKNDSYFKNQFSIQIKTNKMLEILNFLKILVNNENDFNKFLNPRYFDNLKVNKNNNTPAINHIPNFNDKDDVTANSTFSALGLFYATLFSFMDNVTISDLYNNELVAEKDDSCLKDFKGDVIESFLIKPIKLENEEREIFRQYLKDSVKRYKNEENILLFFDLKLTNFVTIGKGYEFGGSQEVYENMVNRREDCSSFISNIFNIIRLSTSDFVDFYQFSKKVILKGIIEKNELNEKKLLELENRLNILKNKFGSYLNEQFADKVEPIIYDELESSDIVVWRGHCGIFSNFEDKNKGIIKILAVSRNIPDYEGFGEQTFNLNEERIVNGKNLGKRETAFFRAKITENRNKEPSICKKK